MMTAAMPKTLDEYLAQLRQALAGADPALIQDALYDAEEHVRAEMAEHPGMDPETLLAKIAGSYGAPDEVAEIYRDQEVRLARALRTPRPPVRKSPIGRFFGVAADPRAYAALFYMLLSLATGIFYFTWAVTGTSLSLGLSVLIIGLPFIVLFIGTVRVLALVEGRIVEVMLGERMPRRPIHPPRDRHLLSRIANMFRDPRTWSTLLYMVLMLPLGIFWFVLAVVGTVVPVALVVAPIVHGLWAIGWVDFGTGAEISFPTDVSPLVVEPLMVVAGVLLLFAMLHVARGVGRFQGALAKGLLVRSGD